MNENEPQVAAPSQFDNIINLKECDSQMEVKTVLKITVMFYLRKLMKRATNNNSIL